MSKDDARLTSSAPAQSAGRAVLLKTAVLTGPDNTTARDQRVHIEVFAVNEENEGGMGDGVRHSHATHFNPLSPTTSVRWSRFNL